MNDTPLITVGATGMLRPAVRHLLGRGHTVLSVARRPERGSPAEPGPGRFIPVIGRWSDPAELAESLLTAIEENDLDRAMIAGAIAWVHSPYREDVLDQLGRVLPAGARLLQLWGSAGTDPREVMAAQPEGERPWSMRHVLLGYHRDAASARWLTDQEISEATIDAWDGSETITIAGRIDPWEGRP